MVKKHTYGKHEKLKSRKLIEEVFTKGQVVKAYPIRLHYLIHDNEEYSPLQAGVSVSKRNFKRAVDRNRVKRLLREAYRLQNEELKNWVKEHNKQIAIMIIYGNNALPETSFTMQRTEVLLAKLKDKLMQHRLQ